MSVVYLAMDKRLNKQWAVKEYRQDSQFQQLAKESLLKEASLMKKLDHPRLPRIVDIIDNGNTIYIIMDYIEGEPFNKILDAYGAQPQEAVVEWGKQLAEVLDYLHTLSPVVVYRDMKPANIMLKPDNTIRLFDFGIAKEIEEDADGGTTVGTRGYAAPEQFSRGARIDGRTDIYALGVTLYHLVTGKNPAEPPYELYPIRHWDPSLSSGLEWLIQKCTQLNPNDRYQSCAEVTYVLENLDKFESAYKSKLKRKLNIFIASVALTVVFALVGTFGLVMKNHTLSSDMDNYMQQNTISGYQDAIDRDSTYAPAYIALADAYTDEYGSTDTRFTENEPMNSAFSEAHLQALKKEDGDSYVKLCYKLGNLYWNYYSADGDSIQTMMAARKYYVKALDALAEDPEVAALDASEKEQAQLYVMLAEYSGKDALDTMNGDAQVPKEDRNGDTMTVETYWTLNNDILDSIAGSAKDAQFTNIVKLTALQRVSYIMQSSFDLFSNNGISKSELQGIYQRMKTIDESIQANAQTKSAELKSTVESNLTLFERLISGLKEGSEA
jgi:serine/threonine-protein kinase